MPWDLLDDRLVIVRDKPLFEAEVDDDILGLCVDTGYCFGFNATAAEIWRALEQPRSVAEIVAHLTGEFDVSADRCGREVRMALRALHEDGLVRIERAALA